MTEEEDYIVQNPYHPTEKEKLAIEELANKGLDSGDWNSKKTGITEFKDHMREHMYYEQNCRCAYCRTELPIACCFLQRDHIVPKAHILNGCSNLAIYALLVINVIILREIKRC